MPHDFEENISCEEFQAHLPELIASGEDLSNHPHLRTCALCSALLADLESIASAARQLFPVEDPPDHLWARIQENIAKEDTASRH